MYFFPGVCRFVLAVSFVVYWFLDSIELHFEIVFHVVHGTIEQTLTFLIAQVYKCKTHNVQFIHQIFMQLLHSTVLYKDSPRGCARERERANLRVLFRNNLAVMNFYGNAFRAASYSRARFSLRNFTEANSKTRLACELCARSSR